MFHTLSRRSNAARGKFSYNSKNKIERITKIYYERLHRAEPKDVTDIVQNFDLFFFCGSPCMNARMTIMGIKLYKTPIIFFAC